jgi:hypothetical protein
VIAVGGAEGIVDVDVGKPGQRCAEGLDLFGIGLDLADLPSAPFDGALAFFLDMEAQVFEQDDFAGLIWAQAASTSGPTQSPKEASPVARAGPPVRWPPAQAELRHGLAVGTAKVRHENDGGTLVQSILDRRQRGFDALGVGDRSRHLVLRDVEIDAIRTRLPSRARSSMNSLDMISSRVSWC